jgi:hypothetical protein
MDRFISFLKSLRERQALLALLAVTFGLRVYAVLMAKGIAQDSAGYGFMARDFLKGDAAKALSSPLHPFYSFLISLVAFDPAHVEIAGRLLSLLFGTFTLIPLYYLIREEVGEAEALLAGLFYAFHPYLAVYSGMLLTEATYWGLLTLSIYFFWTGLKKEKAGRIIVSALLLAMAYLTRPEGIGYLFVFTVWIILYGGVKQGWAKKAILLAGLLVPFVILVIPYVVHLHGEMGQWLISKKALEAQGPLLTPSETSTRVHNLVRFLPFTLYHYLWAYHFTLWLFLFFGLVRARQREVKYEWFIASIILFHIVSLATFNPSTIRFSIPVVPLALFWAGAGVLELQRRFQKLNLSQPGKWVFVLVVLALMTQMPRSLRPERGHREYQQKAGIWMRENMVQDAIVMGNSPIEGFYAEREFVMMPLEIPQLGNPRKSYEEIIDFAKRKNVRYIFFNESASERNPDFVKSVSSSDLKELRTIEEKSGNNQIRIYEVLY